MEICASRLPTPYTSTLAISSNGKPNWRYRPARRRRRGSYHSGGSDGPAGCHRTGLRPKPTGAIRASIRQSGYGVNTQWRRTPRGRRGEVMADISLEAVTGKLNRLGYDAFIQAFRHAKGAGNRNVELAHWLFHILQVDRADVGLTLDYFKLDRSKVLGDVGTAINGFRKNETEMPNISNVVIDALDRGWHYATLFFGETQIRSGHLLVAVLKSGDLRPPLTNVSAHFDKINVDQLLNEHRAAWSGSEEDNMRPMDGSGLRAAGTPGAEQAAAKGTTDRKR